jgi:hypothetical protein
MKIHWNFKLDFHNFLLVQKLNKTLFHKFAIQKEQLLNNF